MNSKRFQMARMAAVGVVAGLVLTGCGGGDIKETGTASGDGKECGDFNMAINPWVGYEASAHVVGYVAKSELGCKVEYKDLKEEVAWQGFGSGEVDAVIENWGHDDLKKKYVEGNKTAQVAGPNGNLGIIGWYVPPWLAEEHPEILDYENLNDFAADFATSETGDKGQFLGADPSFVQFDEAIIDNLGLNFEVVFSGSEAASIEAFERAEKNKEFLIGYFYEPQWFMSVVPLEKVALPPYEEGCQQPPAATDCDYPETVLKKIVSTEWADSGDPSVELVQSFEWTNDDQNEVAKYISQDGMSPEDAAAQWVADNPDKVEAWLP